MGRAATPRSRTPGSRRCSRRGRATSRWSIELQDPSWHVDETFAALRRRRVLCTTDLPPEGDEGAVGAGAATGRRGDPSRRSSGAPARSCTCACGGTTTTPAALDAWAARIEPFLAAGDDVYVFFRHDAVGRAAELAELGRLGV